MKQYFIDFKNMLKNDQGYLISACMAICSMFALLKLSSFVIFSIFTSSFGYMIQVSLILLASMGENTAMLMVLTMVFLYFSVLGLTVFLAIKFGNILSAFMEKTYRNEKEVDMFYELKNQKTLLEIVP